MKIIKSDIRLDSACPFQIERQILYQTDNRPDCFHWHSCFEITLILHGRGVYYVNEQTYEVTDGDIILFNNVEPHGWEVLSGTLDLLVMIFQTEFIAAGFAVMDYDYLKPFIERGSNFKNRLDSHSPLTGEIASLMRSVEEEFTQKTTGHLLMIKADVLKILTLLIRHSQDSTKSAALLQEKKVKMMRLASVFDFINSHFTERITLSDAAAIAFMSPNYFSAYFHKVTGRHFNEYVNSLRVAMADRLLAETDGSVLEVASRCGFRNMSNFYRIYKKAHGDVPPRERSAQ